MKYRNKTIGQKLRIFREQKRFTQEELSEYINLDHAAISRIELNKQVIKAEDLFDIAGILGINIYDFGTI